MATSERMVASFRNAFNRGIDRVVLVGTDCPEITTAILDQAATALMRADLVLGPADDGGYYLIGLARSLPELFEGISWGGGDVFDATRAACDALGIVPAILPELRDVDRLDDLKALGLWPS